MAVQRARGLAHVAVVRFEQRRLIQDLIQPIKEPVRDVLQEGVSTTRCTQLTLARELGFLGPQIRGKGTPPPYGQRFTTLDLAGYTG